MKIKIRSIEKRDNEELSLVFREVLIEYNVPRTGTAFADPELDTMFEAYQKPRSRYFVIEGDEKILGGAGISPLANESEAICELQKMYFSPVVRGKGWGSKMMSICMDFAKSQNFLKCYIETMDNMKTAQKMYVKKGFHYIDKSMGNTGHCSCNIWLLKTI